MSATEEIGRVPIVLLTTNQLSKEAPILSNKELKLKYGKTELSLNIPSEQLICEVVGKECQAVSDLIGALKQALAHPIDSPPMKEIVRPNEKVVIAVSDITRAWQRMDLLLPTILDELNAAGVPDANITIIIANGAHRLNTEAEFQILCGQAVCNRVKVVNHDAFDEDCLVYKGKTSRGTEVYLNKLAADADRIILTGGIIYHYMVGYGGGRKSIMPGLSGVKTIRQSHLWALGREEGSGSNPTAYSGHTNGNESNEDMIEVAAFAKPDFIINTVPTPDGQVAGIFAGNWMTAWLSGTKMVDDIYGVNIPAKADIVVSTAGGYPKDINLYQTGKTIDNAGYAVKKGGVVIILSECEDIYEPQEFSGWFNHGGAKQAEKVLRQNFGIPGWVALKQMECSNLATFIMITKPENKPLVDKLFIPATSMEEALSIAYSKCSTPTPSFIIMPQGANTVPLIDGKPVVG